MAGSGRSTAVIPSEGCKRSRRTTGVDDAISPSSVTATGASFARFFCAKPNWTRQRNTMLVTMPWRRQTAATLTPGCSVSITMANLSSSVKLRRFERSSCGGSTPGTSVKPSSGVCSLAALLTPVLILFAGERSDEETLASRFRPRRR